MAMIPLVPIPRLPFTNFLQALLNPRVRKSLRPISLLLVVYVSSGKPATFWVTLTRILLGDAKGSPWT